MANGHKFRFGKEEKYQILTLRYNGNSAEEYDVFYESTFGAPAVIKGWDSVKIYFKTRNFVVHFNTAKTNNNKINDRQRKELEKIVSARNAEVEKNFHENEEFLHFC